MTSTSLAPSFNLTDEQRMFAESLRAALGDRHRLSDTVVGDAHRHERLLRAVRDLGLFELAAAGAGADDGPTVVDLVVACGELGRAGAPMPYEAHAAAVWALHRWSVAGSSDAGANVDALVSGDAMATLALCEGESWFGGGWMTELHDGRVTGRKRHVPASDTTTHAVVAVAGGGLALVDLRGPGVEAVQREAADTTRPLMDVVFSAAPAVPIVTDDLSAACELTDLAALLVSASALGAAGSMLDQAIEHLTNREQFGQKLVTFQAIRHQLADVALELQPCQGLVWYTARELDGDRDGRSRLVSMCKAHITETALRMARKLIPLQGAIAFTWDYGAHVALKRIVQDRALYGAPEDHRHRALESAHWAPRRSQARAGVESV